MSLRPKAGGEIGYAWATTTTPVRFTGTIHNVTMDVSGDLIKDRAAETRILIARQ
jgi:hypothetical protein